VSLKSPEGNEKEVGAKTILEESVAEIFPNLREAINPVLTTARHVE